MIGARMYRTVMRSSAKYSVCIYIISVEVIIYNGNVRKSSQALMRAPSMKASDGDLTVRARCWMPLARLRGMKSSVSLE